MLNGKDTAIVMSGMLLAVMIAFQCPEWLHAGSWHVAVLHHLFHANVFHLAVNCLSLWLLFRKTVLRPSVLVTAYLCASASWFASSVDVVGASNFIYAFVGLRTPSFRSGWWKLPSVRMFLAITLLMAVFPQVSAVTHVVSFMLGCLCSAVSRIIKRISDDLDRISSH